MVIKVVDIVDACNTNAQGDALQRAICHALSGDSIVTVSFHGVPNVTSSFVNSAFVQLLTRMPFADFKQRIRVIDANPQIRDMIRRRMVFEADRIAPEAA